MSEGARFFQGTNETHLALKKITRKLSELGIDYVVVGGMAMFQHGYRRFTEDVDILVTRESLKAVHQKLDGLGYRPPFQGSKNLRDTEHGVKIEFLVTGEFPGDGKPKPVAFPAPAAVAEEINGLRYINLAALAELKLASGMTNAERMRDLADVIEMIKVLALPRDFAGKLNPFVQEKYRQLWDDAHPAAKRYMSLLRIDERAARADSWEELIAALPSAADTLRAMLADGVTFVAVRRERENYIGSRDDRSDHREKVRYARRERVRVTHSAPICAPFSAIERRMLKSSSTSRPATTAEHQKTSKYESERACCARRSCSAASAIRRAATGSPVCCKKNACTR